MSDGDKYCEENCNRKGNRGWWIREWDGLALSSIGWLDKTSLMWWQLKEVKEGSMGPSEHSKKREQWAWRLWSGNIYGASSSSREARVVRTEVKGRQVGDEDKGNRVGGQIICNSKLGAWSPDPPSMFFHFLFSEFFPLSLLSLDFQKETLYMCAAPWRPYSAVLMFRFWNWAMCVQILFHVSLGKFPSLSVFYFLHLKNKDGGGMLLLLLMMISFTS